MGTCEFGRKKKAGSLSGEGFAHQDADRESGPALERRDTVLFLAGTLCEQLPLKSKDFCPQISKGRNQEPESALVPADGTSILQLQKNNSQH